MAYLRPPIAIFLVRVWYEEDQVRARIISTSDVCLEETTEFATADAERVVEELRVWLQRLKDRNDHD